MPVSGVAAPSVRRPAAQMRIALALMLILPTFAAAAPAWAAAPSNDNIGDAVLLRGASGSVDGTTVDATVETNEGHYAGSTVWYRISVGAGERLVTHTCASTSSINSGIGLFDSTLSAPTLADDLHLLGSNSDWATNDFGGANYDSTIAALDCAGQSSGLSWISATAASDTTIWIQIGPSAGSTDAFTLSWYKIKGNTSADKLSGKLTVSRTDSSSCLLVVKASGLAAFTYFKVRANISTSSYFYGSAYGQTNARGVLALSELLPRATWNSNSSVEIILLNTSGGQYETLTATTTNRCAPAA